MEAGEISEDTDGLWWTVLKAKTKNVKHEEATDFRMQLLGRAEQIVRRSLEVYPEGYHFFVLRHIRTLETKVGADACVLLVAVPQNCIGAEKASADRHALGSA